MEQTDTARTGTFRIDEPRLSACLASMARAYAFFQLDAGHALPMEDTVRAFLKGASAALSVVLDISMETAACAATAGAARPQESETDKNQH